MLNLLITKHILWEKGQKSYSFSFVTERCPFEKDKKICPFLSCVPSVASGIAERSQRKELKETPPSKSPFVRETKFIPRENPLHKSFGMARKACAPYGARHVFFINTQLNSKTFRTKRSLEDVLLSESSSILVSRERDKQIDMRCCLSGASSSNDYDNITSGL